MHLHKDLTPETVRTHGRVYWDRGLRPEWTNAGFSLRFRGDRVTLGLLPPETPPDMPPYLDFAVDGAPALCAAVEPDTRELTVEGLADGEHLLRVRKRSEARESPMALLGVTVEGAAPALLPPPAPSPRRLEFLGDSLTCGFGNEGAPGDPFRTSQEDGTRTAAALTAAHFGADDRYVCISGQGIVRNCNGETDRPIPTLFHWNSPTRRDEPDFTLWQPHAVIINAGTNDMGGGVEPALFRRGTADFLRDIRRVYPRAWVIFSYGMCNTGLMEAARLAVEDTADARMAFLPLEPIRQEEGEFGACSHPTLKAHRRFAGAYIPLVAELTGWK